jgi:hypothetical protein
MVKWRPNQRFEILRVLDLPLFEADKIAKLIPDDMEFGQFLSEDEINKAVRRKSMIK